MREPAPPLEPPPFLAVGIWWLVFAFLAVPVLLVWEARTTRKAWRALVERSP